MTAAPPGPARRRPRVVIVGAGFGGLEAAKALAGAPVDVTIIDRQNHHTFQPLLYQVATAALSPADIAWPIRGLLSGQKNVRVVMADVTGVDTAARRVRAGDLERFPQKWEPVLRLESAQAIESEPVHPDRVDRTRSGQALSFDYDYLVVATGARPFYFGHDDWAAVAPELKRIEDATRIRQRLLLAFEQAELMEKAADQRRLLTFVVVGGGPTGVELAGAIAEVAREALPRDFSRIDPRTARVVLIEAGARLLAAFPDPLAAYARRTLGRMGVEVMTDTPVTGCDERGVDLKSGRIDAGTVVWAAGVRGSDAATWLGADHDRSGRVRVERDLSAPGLPEVFVIGDTATVVGDKGRPVPGLAAAAKQMGRYVGRLIAARAIDARVGDARVGGEAPTAPFRYRNYGDLATIGRKAAVVDLGPLRLTGLIGWLFWSAIHIYFLIGLRNRFIVAFTWAWSYLTRQRGARLILGGPDIA